MSKSQAAPLIIPGLSKKGEATPVVQSLEDVPTPTPPGPPPLRIGSRVQATIAVTVRLDESRYERMKTWGISRRVTNQDVIVAALDGFFSMSDQEREEALASLRK